MIRRVAPWSAPWTPTTATASDSSRGSSAAWATATPSAPAAIPADPIGVRRIVTNAQPVSTTATIIRLTSDLGDAGAERGQTERHGATAVTAAA